MGDTLSKVIGYSVLIYPRVHLFLSGALAIYSSHMCPESYVALLYSSLGEKFAYMSMGVDLYLVYDLRLSYVLNVSIISQALLPPIYACGYSLSLELYFVVRI